MSSPYTFENSLRYHDVAVYEWLKGLHVDYRIKDDPLVLRPDEEVLSIFASPSRPFAQVADLLVARDFFHDMGLTPAQMTEMAEDQFHAILPLPIITIQRADPQPDTELASVPKVFRRKYLNPLTGKWEFHPWPGHYRTEYTFTLWSQNKMTEAFLLEWFYAQIGKVGAADNETFIAVNHDEPWGTLKQSFKLSGSSDLSELESADNPRWLRHELSFSLRTWIMRLSAVSYDYHDRQGLDVDQIGPEGPYGNCTDEGTPLDVANTGIQTLNLFEFSLPPNRVPTLWPKTGNATVAMGDESPGGTYKTRFHPTLRIGVEEPTDTVSLLERLYVKDDDDLGIVGFSFAYKATLPVEFEVHTKDYTADQEFSAFSLVLPAASRWKKVHRFTVVNKDSFIAKIAGIMGQNPQEARLSDLDFRVISSLTKVPPTGNIDLGTEIKYFWNGLEKAPYLGIIVVAATTGGNNEVVLEDDDVNPDTSRSQIVDAAVNVGAVLLSQPKHSSLALRVPKDVTVSSVYVQRFLPAYNGDELD